MTNTTYNGWTNYATWNAALWIGNDEFLYDQARRYGRHGYDSMIQILETSAGLATPDGVNWNDPAIDHAEMDEMLSELTD